MQAQIIVLIISRLVDLRQYFDCEKRRPLSTIHWVSVYEIREGIKLQTMNITFVQPSDNHFFYCQFFHFWSQWNYPGSFHDILCSIRISYSYFFVICLFKWTENAFCEALCRWWRMVDYSFWASSGRFNYQAKCYKI